MKRRASSILVLLLATALAAPALAAEPAVDACPLPSPALAASAAPIPGAPAAEALPFLTAEPLFAAGGMCKSCTSHAQCQSACGGNGGCLRDLGLVCGDNPNAKYCFCF